MDRKTTIKIMREIIRILKDEDLFTADDYTTTELIGGDFIRSRVQQYIMKKLEL